jgi:hypothetical protein
MILPTWVSPQISRQLSKIEAGAGLRLRASFYFNTTSAITGKWSEG